MVGNKGIKIFLSFSAFFINWWKADAFNSNKAGLFEGSISCGEGRGGQFDPPSYLKKNLSNINITLYNSSTIYLKYVEN